MRHGTIVWWSTANDAYVVDVPELPGCIAHGVTRNAAVGNAEDAIEFSFADKFIYSGGLAILAAWRKRLSAAIQISIDASKCREAARRVLTNSALRDILESNTESPTISRNVYAKVPLQPIVPGFSTEKAIKRVYTMFDDYTGRIR